MLKKIWIILFLILMYGGTAALFFSFLLNWGKVAVVVSLGVVVLSGIILFWKLRCPHCKKAAIPTKGLFLGIKIGKCVCANCGEEVEVK